MIAVAIGCASSVTEPDSETHWLKSCAANADCASGLSCVCGTCTRTCTADGCSDLGATAKCLTPTPSVAATSCATPPTTAICTAACTADADCAARGSALHCIGRACLVGAGAPVRDGGSDASGDAAVRCRTDSDCRAPGSDVPSTCVSDDRAWRCGPVEVGMPCTQDADCPKSDTCRPAALPDGGPGASRLVCVDAPVCTEDAQCREGEVCRRDPTVPTGWAGPTGLVCASPCVTDHDCFPTDKCESNGHCQARTCAECPSYLSCTSGTCVIPSCSTDTDCPGGYCVAGGCSGSLGVCALVCF